MPTKKELMEANAELVEGLQSIRDTINELIDGYEGDDEDDDDSDDDQDD